MRHSLFRDMMLPSTIDYHHKLVRRWFLLLLVVKAYAQSNNPQQDGPFLLGLRLIDVETNQLVHEYDPISDGDVLYIDKEPTKYNIEAVAGAERSIRSIQFKIENEQATFRRTEGRAPFSVCGDTAGVFHPCDRLLSTGSITLTATPYSGSRATGTRGPSLRITFSMEQKATIPALVRKRDSTPPPSADVPPPDAPREFGPYSGSGCAINGPEPTRTNTVMKFVAFGDTPYDEEAGAPFIGEEYNCVKNRMIPGITNMADKVDFVVHVGDIKKGSSAYQEYCTDEVFGNRRDLFDGLETGGLDFLIVPGDNEWTECKHYDHDPNVNDEAKTKWRQYFASGNFASFDRIFPYGGSVRLRRHLRKPELFQFEYLDILFFGIVSPDYDDSYDSVNSNWIRNNLSRRSSLPSAIVIMGHADLTQSILSILPKSVPTLYVRGNEHLYCSALLDRDRYPNLVSFTVDAYMAPPAIISVVKDDEGAHRFHIGSTGYGC